MRARTWILLSLLLCGAGAVLWHRATQRRAATALAEAIVPSRVSGLNPNLAAALRQGLLTSQSLFHSSNPAPARPTGHRLTNTARPIAELTRSDRAVLLRNAFIETAGVPPLNVPKHLRAPEDPGSYIVQAKGNLDDTFRSNLRQAGATIVSYIPNNAYLVRMDGAGARQIAQSPRTQAVLPYEPYYKLDEQLLAVAVDQKFLPAAARLIVTSFPDDAGETLAAVRKLGAEVIGEDRSPFGPQLIIQPAADSLVALANLSSVQGLETFHQRAPLNDHARVRVGVSPDTFSTATNNYLGLTGAGVLVNINDTGVDQTHPDLTGRVTASDPQTLQDFDGHGTHVAGTIASSGKSSATVTNAQGSLTNADFRGLAPAAKLFALPIDLNTGPLVSDSFLQEAAAGENQRQFPARPLISNNSWGYPAVNDYNSSAASYDAAVRDALPAVTGAQPTLYVFAAGNNGSLTDDGLGGEANSIVSPATAKNVISVGAIESVRMMTNFIIVTNVVANSDLPGDLVTNVSTNFFFLAATDSDHQVASFSSRGNVGVGLEGQFGRFKPDVVAPGSFTISTRSKDWTDPTNFTQVDIQTVSDETVDPGQLSGVHQVLVPDDASELRIVLVPNPRSATPFPQLPLYARLDDFPDTNIFTTVGTNQIQVPSVDVQLTPGFWNYRVFNPTAHPVFYDVQAFVTRTNLDEAYFKALKQADDGLGPYYRYDSGTSMAAPVVSGLLALMQEFFEKQKVSYSPALMKALLINGARSVGPLYDFNVNALLNHQGWGVVNIANSLPAALQSGNTDASPLRFVDQSVTNALVTGQSLTWNLQLSEEAQQQPLRVTLVWTDPPGNPNAAVKLVNDLDLIVTNLDATTNQVVYYGNNIPAGADFTAPSFPESVQPGSVTASDPVNNVENVYLNAPVGTNFSVTVFARRVNVNAVTQHPDGIAQDFALVVSSGDGTVTNAFTFAPLAAIPLTTPTLSIVSNGVPLLHERVGANSPLLGGTNGTPSQWNFYVFTNSFNLTNSVSLTNGTNVAFITFNPPNIGNPRNVDADIDLYVSRGTPITTLNFTGASITASTKRGGTEVVFFTNSFDGEVFYVGVKAEDQQGGEYGFVTLSSNTPFNREENGNLIVQGFPLSAQVSDGSPQQPGAALVFGIATRPIQVQKAVAELSLTHESLGDLLANLSHNNQFAVLLNHHLIEPPPLNGFYSFGFDDNELGDAVNLGDQPSDGPGSLNNFIGEDGSGLWLMTLVDNAVGGTGRLNNFNVVLTPSPGTNLISGTVRAHRFAYYFVDVPVDATNLMATLFNFTPSLSLDAYFRRTDLPDQTTYDKFAIIPPTGGNLTITTGDIPPLNAGRYFLGIFNPNSVDVNFKLRFSIGRDIGTVADASFASEGEVPLLDDAFTESIITVPIDRVVADVNVAVRIDHPRLSDLALHLISPQGTRILLAEDRGGLQAANFGSGSLESNLTYTGFTERPELSTGLFKFAVPPYATNAVVITNFVSGFEGVPAIVYPAGQTVDGWFVVTNRAAVLNLGGAADSGTNVLSLNRSYIRRVFPTVAGKQYTLRFALRSSVSGTVNLQLYLDDQLKRFVTASSQWQKAAHTFTADRSGTLVEIRPLFSHAGLLLDTFELVETGGSTIFYQPEESLDLLKGERAIGNWRLEIADTRSEFAGKLLNWQLEFIFAEETKPAVTLVNGACFSGQVSGDEIKYFIVEVPQAATQATNILTGTGDLVLYFNQNAAPTAGTSDFAVDFNGPGDGEVLLLSTNGATAFDPSGATLATFPTPQLQPGQRYYLGVANFNPGETNDFTLCLGFDRIDETLIVLTNKIPHDNTIKGGGKFDYYQFTILPTAYEATFELFPTNGNVDLYVNQGFPLPTTNFFNFRSTNASTNAERITLTITNTPKPLEPGDYYLGVYHPGGAPVDYSVVATQLTNAVNLVRLTNCEPLSFTVPPGAMITNYFVFTIDQTNAAAKFTISNFTGEAELWLGNNELPTKNSFFRKAPASLALPGSGKIVIRTNVDFYPTINGDWYLAVLNKETNAISFDLRACTLDPKLVITPLTNGLTFTNTAPGNTDGSPPEIDYYSFEVFTNDTYRLENVKVEFVVAPFNGNVDLVVSKAPGLPTDTKFQLSSNNGRNTNELVGLSIGRNLSPGTWYLGVFNRETNQFRGVPITYLVTATESPGLITLPPGTNTIIEPNIVVTNNQVCLNWPAIIARDYQVEARQLIDTSGWTNLSGTITAITTNLSYCVPITTPYRFFRIVQLGRTNPPPPATAGTNIIAASLSLTNKQACLSWNAVVGRSYLLEGKKNVEDLAWAVLSPLQKILNSPAGGTQRLSYCVDLSSGYRFFRVLEFIEGAPPSPPPPASGTNTFINPSLAVTNNQICLSWDETIGRQYFVEAKTNLTDAAWLAISPTNTATTTRVTFCLDLSTPRHFFRVVQLGSNSTNIPPPAVTTDSIVNSSLVISNTQACVAWDSIAGRGYLVEGKSNITDAAWSSLSAATATTTARSSFCVNLTSGYQFFRVVQVGAGSTNTPPPAPPSTTTTNAFIRPTLSFTNSQVCLHWDSVAGRRYYARAKVTLGDTDWSVISTTNQATTSTMQFCLDLTTSFRFFEVVEIADAGSTSSPAPAAITIDTAGLTFAPGGFSLKWHALASDKFQIQYATNLPPVWITLPNTITSTDGNFSFADDGSKTGGVGAQKYYRLLLVP
ncbi:MAG: S8 family serine peptidase [Verrucomicrobia bacterium]|nr:S8 family serine peptidase [Verrucomicrobiota bacterium]